SWQRQSSGWRAAASRATSPEAARVASAERAGKRPISGGSITASAWQTPVRFLTPVEARISQTGGLREIHPDPCTGTDRDLDRCEDRVRPRGLHGPRAPVRGRRTLHHLALATPDRPQRHDRHDTSTSAVIRITGGTAVPRSEQTDRAPRGGGPGGKHENTSGTRVELTWDDANTTALTEEQRARVLQKLANRIDESGTLRLVASENR